MRSRTSMEGPTQSISMKVNMRTLTVTTTAANANSNLKPQNILASSCLTTRYLPYKLGQHI